MILLGFFLRKESVVTAQFEHELGNFLITVVLPICVLASSNAQYTSNLSQNLLLSAIISGCYYVVALLILLFLVRFLHAEEQAKKIFVCLCVFANTSFLGLPIISEIFGEEGVLYAVIYNLAYQVFFFSIGVTIVNGKSEKFWKSIFLDPGTIASIAAIIIFLSPFRFPKVLADTFEMIGNMMVPMSMIIIGCKLAKTDLKQLFVNKLSFGVSAIRLLIFPLIMFSILRLFSLGTVLTGSMVILTGLPSGALNVIIADKYYCDEALAACAVSQSTFLMIFTLPLILLLLA